MTEITECSRCGIIIRIAFIEEASIYTGAQPKSKPFCWACIQEKIEEANEEIARAKAEIIKYEEAKKQIEGRY